ncbi:hypothetical protein EHM94_05765 [Marinobacter sp. NP-6]|uniref:hypothetical protein n=1 Tax=Marinobacter sp. NP-6 TaxID=2488666 RepID=UPI000FCB49B6|nr:hypothetical protein [Marinobacter sp. NP-6]RUT74700.1 hypothetical protein EHM94_05765 [Marinobacter sp. NP-6]
MGGSSKSSNSTSSRAYNFNNIDYGSGSGPAGGLAKNVNAVNSDISTGSIFMTTTDQGATREAGRTARSAIAGNTDVAKSALSASALMAELGFEDTKDSRDFAESVFGDASGVVSSATDRAYDDVADSRQQSTKLFSEAGAWIAGAFDKSSEEVAQANREALQFASQDVERALSFAQMSTRSEAGKTVESVSKIVFLGVGALGVLYVIAQRGK